MLYLNPPYHVINGVSLMPDHADPLQWYYLPLAPHLSTTPDAQGRPRPSLELIEYRGGAGSGGLLDFDVNIGVQQSALDDIATELRSAASLSDTPRLAPVPLVDGSVRLMLLGATSGPAAPAGGGGPLTGAGGGGGAATATAPGPTVTVTQETGDAARFVVSVDQASKPSLFGDDQATFSVALDGDGAVLMKQALHGEELPIGVVYQLDFLALRPAFTVSVQVDWERVQHQLDEQFGVSAVFFSSQIDKAVDQLIESQAITFKVDSFVDAGSDPTVISDQDKAVAEARELITAAFFKPSIDPTHPAKDGWDKAMGVVDRVSQMAVTGGLASVATFSYSHTDYTRIDKKYLNFDMTERTTIRRSIYPQGHLSSLAQSAAAAGLNVDDFIMSVDLNDPWFATRNVQVIGHAAFDIDAIDSVNVTLTYGGTPKNVILTPSAPSGTVSWPSTLSGGAMERPVQVQYDIVFKPVSGLDRPPTLSSQATVTEVDAIDVDPRDLYALDDVPISALGVAWDQWSAIEVDLHYTDAANGIDQHGHYVLDKDHAGPELWQLFRRNSALTEFSYRLSYRGAGRPDYIQDWAPTTEPEITVHDPLGSRLSVLVIPNVDWTAVDHVFVDVSYTDPAHQLSYSQTYDFSEHASDTQTFSLELRDPSLRRVGFDATVLFKDGHEAQIPPSFTEQSLLVIRPDMRGHRVVLVSGDKDLAAAHVSQIQVALSYHDDAHSLSYSQTVTLTEQSPAGAFEFDYVDPNLIAYQWSATYTYADGLSRSTDPATTDQDTLTIPVS